MKNIVKIQSGRNFHSVFERTFENSMDNSTIAYELCFQKSKQYWALGVHNNIFYLF